MQEKQVKLDGIPSSSVYRAWYRCTNCGTIFQYDMQVGKPAAEMVGSCPHCRVTSGKPKVGVFPIVKFNPEHDMPERHYFR